MSKPGPTPPNCLKTYILLLVLVTISANSFSQQSSLTINANTTEGEDASGYFMLTDNALQDSMWIAEITNGSVYFPFYTLGIGDFQWEESILIYPNPAGGSRDAQLFINSGYQLAHIRVYNNTGKLLYAGNPTSAFEIQTFKGLLLFQFEDYEGNITTKKLISKVDNLRFTIVPQYVSQKKSAQAHSYTLTFEDLTPDDPEFSDYTEQINIGETEHQVMDVTLSYQLKNIIIQGNTSPDAQGLIKTGTEELGSIVIGSEGTIDPQTFQFAFSKTRTLPVLIELSDDNADLLILEANVSHNIPHEIDTVLTYQYMLSGTDCSPTGALVEIFDKGNLIGSDSIAGVGNSPGAYQINWSYRAKQLEIDSIRVSSDGYYPEVQKNISTIAGSNLNDVNLKLQCEVDSVGTVTVKNTTGYDIWVDVTWGDLTVNIEKFLNDGDSFKYTQVHAGRIDIWVSFNKTDWYYEIEDLSVCEDMTFTWYLNSKKSAGACPFVLDIGKGELVEPTPGIKE